MKRNCFILFLVLLMVFPMSGCLQGDTEKENSLSHDETTTSSMSSVAIENSSPFPQFNKEFGKAESIHHSKDQDTLSIIYPVTDSEKVNAFLLDLMVNLLWNTARR